MTAHKHPVAPVPASACSPVAGAGTNPIGAAVAVSGAACGPTGEAGASNLSTSMPCRECGGKGEAEYMGLTDSYYRWADCHKCFGSGVEPWYCETCGETLKADGFCVSCDDWGSLIYVERIAPGRVAL